MQSIFNRCILDVAQSPVTTNVAEGGCRRRGQMEDGRWQDVKALSSPNIFWLALQPTRGVDSVLSRDKVVKHD